VRFRTRRDLGREGVDHVIRQTAAEADMRDESVTQILGREVVQRRGCYQASSDRGNVVSLIVNGLHELRQRRPVSLAEETLIELTSQHRPPLLGFHLGRPGYPYLHLVDVAQGLGGGSSRVAVPVLDVGEQGLPDRR
jgi:hypothetical protein